MAKHADFRHEFAWQIGIPLRAANALVRHFCGDNRYRYSARFLIRCVSSTTDRDLKAIPGLGRKSFAQMRYALPYAPVRVGGRRRWGEDAPWAGQQNTAAAYWERLARLERRRANNLERALDRVASECRVGADVFLSRAEQFTEAG